MTPFIEALNRLARAWAGLVWAVTWQSTLLVAVFATRRAGDAALVAESAVLALADRGDQAAGDAALGRLDPPARDTTRGDRQRVSDAWPVARSGGELAVGPEGRRSGDRPGRGGRRPSARWAGERDLDRAESTGKPGCSWAGGSWSPARSRRSRTSENGWSRLLSQAVPGDDPALLALVAELSGRIGLRRRPSVLIVDVTAHPSSAALRRPISGAASGLTRSLDPESLRSVLLHELAHIKAP